MGGGDIGFGWGGVGERLVVTSCAIWGYLGGNRRVPPDVGVFPWKTRARGWGKKRTMKDTEKKVLWGGRWDRDAPQWTKKGGKDSPGGVEQGGWGVVADVTNTGVEKGGALQKAIGARLRGQNEVRWSGGRVFRFHGGSGSSGF